MNPMRRLLKFLDPYKKEAILAIILLTLVVVTDLSIPRLVQTIIDEGIVQNNMGVIIRTSLLMIGISILGAMLMIGNTIFAVRASRNFSADVRKELFTKIQSFSFGNIDDFQTGQLLVRLTSDINQVEFIFTMVLRMFTRVPLMLVGSIGMMVATNRQLAMKMLMLLPLLWIIVIIFVRIAQPLFKEVQERLEKLNQVLQENLAGVRVVKAFVRRDYENKRFDNANKDLMEKSIKVAQILSVLIPIMFLLINLGSVAVIYFGGLQAYYGTISVGEIMAFINYLLSTMYPVLMLAMTAGQISAANASAKRITEILDSQPQVRDRYDALPLPKFKGRVAFENVYFSYDSDGGEPVLKNINLVAEPSQTVALIGATGSGKSSLIHLIPRLYDVSSGKVTIDGVDVRDLSEDSLRSNIGISLQESVLFSGTVRDNIKYGRKDATDDEVIAAAKAAQAHDFIINFPEGYDTMVGQRGANLSGGQKQRVAIARALLIQPKILILDDSTSSVDIDTEVKIEQALDELMTDKTCFVIAQRISTVLNADKIVVLDEGEIVAEGSHLELMDTSPIYREIYDSQLGDGGDPDE